MTHRAADTFTLVADIGGTNTRVALAEGPALLTDTVRKYRNAEYSDLETVIARFISDENGVDCKGACVALAGPVRDGAGSLTNLDWTIDEATLARATQASDVALLNDLQAQGHAVGHLQDGAFRTLVEGPEVEATASKLVIGVGTGFNIAPVFETPAGRFVPAAEAGHANLPVRNEQELALARHFEAAHGFPAVEDMLSGRGVERLYQFLSAEAGEPAKKTAAEIMQAMEAGTDPLAEQAAAFFVRMLGTVAGNLALIHLPFGGVHFVGGVARAFSAHCERLHFVDAFRDKGRFSGFMEQFAVYVIEDDFAALTGCARYLAAR